MANETSTFSTGVRGSGGVNGGNLKENVGDGIYSISPEDTVFLNMCAKGKADGIMQEWLEDSDRAPAVNQRAEEWDGTRAATTQPSRLSNYTQIFGESFGVTETMEVAAKYGRTSEIERLIKKHMRLLAKDIEYGLLNNTTTQAHASGTGGLLKGLKGWVTTNTYDFSSTYVNTNDLTEAKFVEMLQTCWTAGGSPQTVLAPAYVAQAINQFDGQTKLSINMDAEKKTIINAVDYYRSSFGIVQVFLTRWLAPYDDSGTYYDFCAILDKSKWQVDWLRKTKVERQAKTGLITPVVMSAELTLEAHNESANAMISKISRV